MSCFLKWDNVALPISSPDWSDWEESGACSVTCGSGKMSLKRKCSINGKCVGDITKVKNCYKGKCEYLIMIV